MDRKIWALICLALSVGLRVHQHMAGTAVDDGLLFEPFVILWTAFMLPAALPVILLERYAFHLEPWADDNSTRTLLWLTLTASAIWFCPGARIARWFGAFDAFREGKRRRPVLLRGVAYALDMANKRLFGRQKTGGWA